MKILDYLKALIGGTYIRIKKSFNKDFILQQLGATAIIAAFILTWLNWTWTALGLFGAIAIYDILLAVKKKDTISQWVHDLFPRAIDFAIVILIGVFTWAVFGPVGFLPVAMGIVVGHLFWH